MKQECEEKKPRTTKKKASNFLEFDRLIFNFSIILVIYSQALKV